MRQGTNWNTAEDEELTAWLEKIAVSEEPVSPRREADREVEVRAGSARRRVARMITIILNGGRSGLGAY